MILLNGPPGIGKSTCASRWAAGRPGAVVVEIDGLRTSISGWRHDDRSKLEARRMAIDVIDRHLRSGTEVMVPQYLGRPNFIDELQQAAHAAAAEFVEIRLTADEDQVVERFEARRATGSAHPEEEVQDVRVAVADAIARLDHLAAERPAARTVAAGGDMDTTSARVAAALDP